MEQGVDFSAILAAARRLKGRAHRTPVLTCSTLNRLSGLELFFKCEAYQKGGAFKIRGATNAIQLLSEEQAQRGVVTHSSGNHAQAVAIAAAERGIPAWIVMPSNAPEVKRQAVMHYGALVIPCAPTLSDRQSTAARIQRETGATLIPPYDHPHVIAGQGTIGLELLEQIPGLEAAIVPVGGGGLISGITLAMGALSQAPVYGAEPAGADDAARSKDSGILQPQLHPETIADGLRTSLGEHTWPVVRDQVPKIFTVEERDIARALRLVWERMKVLIEPSAAVGVAVALSEAFQEEAREQGLRRVAIVLCGGNLDLRRIPSLLQLAER